MVKKIMIRQMMTRATDPSSSSSASVADLVVHGPWGTAVVVVVVVMGALALESQDTSASPKRAQRVP